MVEAFARNHESGVSSRRFTQTLVHAQRGRAGLFAILVYRLQKLVLGGGILASGLSVRRVRNGGGLIVGGGLLAANIVMRVVGVDCW
jgi:hypothetical protein